MTRAATPYAGPWADLPFDEDAATGRAVGAAEALPVVRPPTSDTPEAAVVDAAPGAQG